LQTSLLCRGTGLNAFNYDAVRRAQGLQRNQIRTVLFLEADTDGATRDAAVLDDLIVDIDCHGGRHCETNTLIAAPTGNDRGVDTDYLASHIYERAARIAGVDCCIGLKKALKLPANISAILGADNSRRDGSVQAEGAADRQHPITHLHAIGIPKLGEGKFFGGINLDDRKVRGVIDAHNLGDVFGRVAAQLYLNLGGLVDNVIVREDVAALVDDHTGAEAALGLRLPVGASVKEMEKEILAGIVLIIRARAALLPAINHLRGGDIDDGGLNASHDAGKGVGRRDRIG